MFHDMMREPALWVLGAIAVAALSGVPGLLLRQGSLGQRVATAGALLASLMALPAISYMLTAGLRARYLIEWNLPFGSCELALDPLTLIFLIPIFLVFAAGSLYACGYWPASSKPASEPPLTFFYGLLAAAMAMVVVSRNGALLVMSWEVMALSGYFLMSAEHTDPEVGKAGLVYLVASHLGAASLLVLFSLLAGATGSFLFPAAGSLHVSSSLAAILFFAALLGFGSKAGIMPLHIWLPSAHANAPSHVSAILSGVMLKMGIYGILRVITFFPERPLWWGELLVVAGLVSALMGICIASAQKDIKRLLAYSSIENLGLITAGIGAALYGEATGSSRLAYLGMAGALFHILNHGMFKPLLFFGAGSVMHATGTREMDRMGGLSSRMPWSTLLSLAGAVAICGLPPFNGFASEFLLYLGFFGEARSSQPLLALGAPVLALVGGVAVISLVKLFGITFLGAPRSEGAAHSHESPASMLVPMGVLAGLSLVGGIFPQLFLSLVNPVVGALALGAPAGYAAPVRPIALTAAGAALPLLAGAIFLVLKRRELASPRATGPTWGCGYLAPAPRIQYTASSFGQLMGSLSTPLIRSRTSRGTVAGVAPVEASFRYQPEETLLGKVAMPALRGAATVSAFIRRLQHGEVQIYMLYIFATLFVLLLSVR
nr:proton-conducting transporter membrane subunit [Geomonas sp. Red32]